MPPTYRQRLRREGAWLAAIGIAGSVALVATSEDARSGPLNTAAQLAVVAGLAVTLGRRGARRSVERALDRRPDELGTGEPTPLWMHPLIVGGLAAVFPLLHAAGVDRSGLDASLRITAGAAVVGLTQAILIERTVAAAERDRGRTYYRAKGSRGLRTVLESTAGAGAATASP